MTKKKKATTGREFQLLGTNVVCAAVAATTARSTNN